jgi:hypothetical protein
MTSVIRNHNDPNFAITWSGQRVNREKSIYLPSHSRSYYCLNTSMHFVFRDPSENPKARSSTLFCTCGSPAGVFDYAAYRRFQSSNQGEAIACIELIQQGRHADFSHE